MACLGSPPSCPAGQAPTCASGSWGCITTGAPSTPVNTSGSGTGNTGTPAPAPAPTTPTPAPAPLPAGGGGGGGSQTPKPKAPDETDPFANQLMSVIQGLLNQGSRFTPEAMERLRGGAIQQAESAGKSQQQSIYADLARRGLLRSGAANPMMLEAMNATMQQRQQLIGQIEVKKVMSDFDDKLSAIDRSQTFLKDWRDYRLGKERNQIARDQISAQYASASLGASQASEQLEFEKKKYEDQQARRSECEAYCSGHPSDTRCPSMCWG
jgi:hypothetical protein